MGKKHKPKKHKYKGSDDDFEEEEEREVDRGTPQPEKESLKIVLKVGGGGDTPSDVSYSSHDDRKHKHKKKKKKKDKDRHRDEKEDRQEEREDVEEANDDDDVSQEDEDEAYEPQASVESQDMMAYEPQVKRARLLDVDEGSNSSQEYQPRRSVRQVVEVKEDEKGVLRECLLYIQKTLQRKDVNGFFAFPVNDTIAPGYSSIIQTPMDFSTMHTKIENDIYDSIVDYKTDFVLMCNNAMTYNRPETIYYKEAKRLLQSGIKMMSKEKLLHMRRSLGFMSSITMEELGLNQEDNTNAVLEELDAKEKEYEITVKNRDNIGRFEAFPDNMTADEILAQAQAAAQEARDLLTVKPIKTKLSYLRKRDDGTTSLTVLNTDNDGIVGENERIIPLGQLLGKLGTGTGNMAGFKEDKRNRASQINYLCYGPFSSHAPTYDTSFSNISKEESDLLLSTYGDESGVQYAESVMKFVEDAEDDCTKIVDSLLDVLTKGQHTITMKQIQQKRKEDQEQLAALQKRMDEVKEEKPDAEETPTSTDVAPGQTEETTSFQSRLDKTAELLTDLQETQHERLSLKPPPHLANIPGPNESERQIADKVTSELTKLAKEVTPQDVTSLRGIRKAMGISVEPVQDTDESQPIEIEDNDEVDQSKSAILSVPFQTDQSEPMLQNSSATGDNYIDNELLMETDGTVIDNL